MKEAKQFHHYGFVIICIIVFFAGCTNESSRIDDGFLGGIKLSKSETSLTVNSRILSPGQSITVTLTVRDQNGNAFYIPNSNPLVVFSISGGTSNGTFGAITDNKNGEYTTQFTGVTSGTASNITASIDGLNIEALANIEVVAVTQAFTLDIPFTTGTESSYILSDATRVDLLGGVARLTPADQTDNSVNTGLTSGGFLNGTTTSVLWDSTNNFLRLDATTNTTELDASWTPQWSNLVGYWKLNNSWADSKGSNTGTASNGATFSATKKMGSHSGVFDGVNDYTSLGTLGSFGSSMGSGYSIAFWVKTTTTSTAKALIGTSNGAAGRGSFSIRLNVKSDNTTAMSGAIRIGFGSENTTPKYVTAGVEVNTGINDGNWHHLAVVVVPTANSVLVAIDGQKQPITYQAQGSPTVFTDFTYPIIIGALNSIGTPTDHANAQMDDLAIWSAALTIDQIFQIYSRQSAIYSGQIISRVLDAFSTQSWTDISLKTALPFYKEMPGAIGSESNNSTSGYSSVYTSTSLNTGLVGYWKLNESSGSTFADASGNNNTGAGVGGHAGTACSSTTYSSACMAANGKFVNGVNVVGSTSISSYVNIPNSATLQDVQENDSTYSAWYFPRALPVNSDAVNFKDAAHGILAKPGQHFGLELRSNGKFFFELWGVGSVNKSISTTLSYPMGQWYHLVAVFNKTAGTASIYVNGKLAAPSISLGGGFSTLEYGTQTWKIGSARDCVSGYCYPANGLIDDVAIWNRILTDGTSGTNNEILQLYRRGANRILYQLRSCANNSCSDQEALVTTGLGWKGPDNTQLSYFSELYNTSSNTLAGIISTGLPNFVFSNFSGTGLSVSSNRYFQYRAILESDDQNTLCDYGSGVTSCSPELQSVSVGPTHYETSVQSIISKATIGSSYQTLDLQGMTETLGANSCSSIAKYSLSSDGLSFYYWDGSAWTASNDYSSANDAATMRTNISSFPSSAAGTGTLQIKTYLKSSGTSPCEIDNLRFTGSKF